MEAVEVVEPSIGAYVDRAEKIRPQLDGIKKIKKELQKEDVDRETLNKQFKELVKLKIEFDEQINAIKNILDKYNIPIIKAKENKGS